MKSECCHATMGPDDRFCPKCGWEARTTDPLHEICRSYVDGKHWFGNRHVKGYWYCNCSLRKPEKPKH